MKLSFAMIVKNEEKNLDRTLRALKCLDGKIEYEIIIVDTGSTDSTIDIAKKYTNKIYYHSWNNNFGDMRNISISYCEGEWIFILDGDEVIENPEQIVKFLKCKENTEVNSAVVKFKNIISEEDENYIEGGLFRLFRNQEGFRYEGRVHEQPIEIPPYGNSGVIIMHYGYSTDNYELMEYKYERNKELLLMDLEDESKDKVYTLFQLAQTYSMAKETRIAIEYIDKAYEIVKNSEISKRKLYVYSFYGKELYAMGNYEKAITVCEEGLKLNNKYLDFYYILCRSNFILGNLEKVENYYKGFFNLLNKQKNEELEYTLIVNFSSSRKDEVRKDMILTFYKKKSFEKAIKIYEEIDNSTIRKELKEVYLYCLLSIDNCEKVYEYYKSKKIEDKDISTILSLLERIKYDKNKNYEYIINKFISIDPRLELYINLIIKDKEINFDYNTIEFKEYYAWKSEIFKNVFRKDNSIISVLKNLTTSDIDSYLYFISGDYLCLNNLYEYSNKNFLTTDIEELKFIIKIEEILLFNKSIDRYKYNKLVKRTMINTNNFIREVYNQNVFELGIVDLVGKENEIFWFNILNQIKKINNKVDYIKGLKNLLKENKKYKHVIKSLMEEIDTSAISKEMLEEKANILLLIEKDFSNGIVDKGIEILYELKKIFIFDGEIYNYIGMANYILGKTEDALVYFSIAYEMSENKFDSAYNIACILEGQDRKESKHYFEKALNLTEDEIIKRELREILEK